MITDTATLPYYDRDFENSIEVKMIDSPYTIELGSIISPIGTENLIIASIVFDHSEVGHKKIETSTGLIIE